MNRISTFINEKGIEVYPVGHPNQGQAVPAHLRARDLSLPPKSEAEDRPVIDQEAQEAIEVLRAKGLL